MNNSLDRLIEGMVETLRREILPNLEGEFVRGQAYGVIYMLKSLQLRASWSPVFLLEQIARLQELAAATAELPAEAPRVKLPEVLPHDARELEALRDAGDAAVSALIGWLTAHEYPAGDAAVETYIHQQLKHELKTSAKPMFAEISLGKEQEA
ncbi:hypothetical protein GCM10010909_25460 [Acidocella aquatica]|uniref:Uncharacterized protein n=1 Tax=Acidocella aquatica TaxID=1922313 RepID=A0ABQ6ACS6_9PROT|nr:hypothetical protein [Acidocella aquatica]GLR67865.1 hypothetical protein GCM10010909_25460 [Acidocella aquatica]